MKKRLLFLLFPMALLLASSPVPKAPTIYLIGDSTMADKPGTPEENPERGWGQLLPERVKEGVAVRNHAVNGRSSKSFISEGRWDAVVNALQKGDYVFIQFGHNDQKDQDSTRYTNPWSSYRHNLEKFVAETRAKGAFPVLLSSIVRRNFNDKGVLIDTHGAYPFVARQVALENRVPFIDMQLMTEAYIAALGPEPSREIYLWTTPGQYARFPDGAKDNTHLSLKGARTFAGLVAAEIKRLRLPLATWLK